MWMMLAELIEKIAVYGAGFLSYGTAYEPDVPDELK